MTTASAIIRQRMSKMMKDWRSSTVTTALAANTSLIDTTLADKRNALDKFNRWWALPTSGANSTKNKVSDDDGASTLTVLTTWATDGSTKATYELHKYDPADKLDAINNAARETYPDLFRELRDRTLVIGSMLPDFDWWTSATAHKFYSLSNATVARTSTAGLVWGGRYSAALLATAANGCMTITSDVWRRLIDLSEKTVTFHVMAYPQSDDGANIEIYTVKKDGTTTQTLTSTTSSYAARWGVLTLDSQVINADLDHIEFRMRSVNNGETVYFACPWISGGTVEELLLPELFQDGEVNQVRIQTSGHSDEIADDVGWGADYQEIFGCQTISDGTYKYLSLPRQYQAQSERRLELIGNAPLEDDLDADTDTMSIDGERVSLLCSYAIYLLYEMYMSTPSSEDTSKFEKMANYWWGRYQTLKKRLGMTTRSGQIGWSING